MESESADAFAAAFTLHNFKEVVRTQLLEQISRILKKGGLFVNADILTHDDPIKHKKDLEDQLRAFDIFEKLGHPELKREWIKHYAEDQKNKFTEAEQIFLLKNNGFADIQTVFRKRLEATVTAVKK